MNYFPNIDKIRSISDLLQHDGANSKSKIEYIVYIYLSEDYKVFDNSRDYWLTTNMIVSSLLSKDFLKSIKKQSQNYIHSQIDQLIVSILLQRSSETPKKKAAIDTINPDLTEDESYRLVSD